MHDLNVTNSAMGGTDPASKQEARERWHFKANNAFHVIQHGKAATVGGEMEDSGQRISLEPREVTGNQGQLGKVAEHRNSSTGIAANGQLGRLMLQLDATNSRGKLDAGLHPLLGTSKGANQKAKVLALMSYTKSPSLGCLQQGAEIC